MHWRYVKTMSDKIVRMNIRVPEHIRDWYKEQGDKYSVPYTNYISMLLTQIYEKEEDKKLVREFNNVMKQMKEMTGDVTAEDMIQQLKGMQDIISKKYKIVD